MITAVFSEIETLNFAHILMSAVVLRAGTAGCFIGRYFHTRGTM